MLGGWGNICCTCTETGEEGKRGIVQMEKPPLQGSAEAVHHRRSVGSANDDGLNVNTKELTLSSATDIAETQKESCG